MMYESDQEDRKMEKVKALIHRTVKRMLKIQSIYEQSRKKVDVIMEQMILDMENTEREK